jgi:hypothetical protein
LDVLEKLTFAGIFLIACLLNLKELPQYLLLENRKEPEKVVGIF